MTQRTFELSGRVLYLTADPELLARQLRGEQLRFDPDRELLDNISTDEIAPAWACYHYDEKLAGYLYCGLRSGVVTAGALLGAGFQVIVSGSSKGCGSSREAAPYAEACAGIRLVVARSFEKIYQQNCHNIGLLTTTEFAVIERLERGEAVSIAELASGLDEISRAVVVSGGLSAYNRARLNGSVTAPVPARAPRAMTLCEKIIASRVVREAGAVGVPSVAPGDAVFVRTDVRFSHEYVTGMAGALFVSGFGQDARVRDPESVYLFRDHLTLLSSVMPDEHRRLGLLEASENLVTAQQQFAERHGLRLFGEVRRDDRGPGSEAICHNKIIEDVALPGQIVVGTDSHTCMAGALGCFAFGIGSTDMASAWYTSDVRIKVPETLRVVLNGRLPAGVCAKDVMLALLARPEFRAGGAIGKVLEFDGPGLWALPLDERATLTNMSVEAGAFTGLCAADQVVLDYLSEQRARPVAEIQQRVVTPDPGAVYAGNIELDLAALEPMVALPGDPRNGVPLSRLAESVAIDIAYGGSCTGGKKADMDMYAAVMERAAALGRGVSAGVTFYIQFGSQHIREYAERRGYIDVFRRAGVQLVEPSCGACIRAGPGISTRPEQVTISAVNRNFPGRSGPGRVYLASPAVVAASAVAGRICAPAELL